jgi:hypothetical protein
MIKLVLKKILPPIVINNLHVRINKFRINTLDRLLFPEKKIISTNFIVKHDKYPFAGVTIATEHLEPRLQQQIEIWQNWTQDEYLLVYEQPCLIEPRSGWALSVDNKLIYPSLGFSRVDYLRKPTLRALQMRNKPVEEYAELISLRDTGEQNYYHFYNDVLTKLLFLEEKLNIGPDVPILVAAALYEKQFFQYFLQHPFLRDRTWVVQNQQYVRSRKTYFCKPLTHTAHYYERIRQLARSADILAMIPQRRIFITRSPKRLRFIENGPEIEQLCREAGFEILDFDTMLLPAQIQALASARYVVGIHGAGLVNILFRGRQPMGLLEIFPPGEYYPFHYMLLAAQLGYAYDGQIGLAAKQAYSGGFYVEPAELRRRVAALLAK